jgi:hypothetical protein
MIRHQDPGQATPAAFDDLPRQTRDEVAAVDVVVKDRAAFDPTQEYVVTDPCAIPASDPRHALHPGPGRSGGYVLRPLRSSPGRGRQLGNSVPKVLRKVPQGAKALGFDCLYLR